ncbi:MAG: hypothetical protein HGB19_07365 [Chlorobiales bacterium]|nr:hypothetical protein [Chlorobiales bacterium]
MKILYRNAHEIKPTFHWFANRENADTQGISGYDGQSRGKAGTTWRKTSGIKASGKGIREDDAGFFEGNDAIPGCANGNLVVAKGSLVFANESLVLAKGYLVHGGPNLDFSQANTFRGEFRGQTHRSAPTIQSRPYKITLSHRAVPHVRVWRPFRT